MNKTAAAGSVLLVSGFLLLSSACGRTNPQTVPSPADELRMKQTMLEQDVNLTDQLHRSQTTLDFKNALHQLNTVPQPNVKSELQKLKNEHEQMDYIEWMDDRLPNQTIAQGRIPESVKTEAESHLDRAKRAVTEGREYQSPRIGSGDQAYFVLGVPGDRAESGKSGLVGVVHQDILSKVEVEQKKNLRIVPFPSDKRWRVESVDSRTLKGVKVDHPEDNEGTSHYHTNEVVVKFRSDPSQAELSSIQSEIGAESVQKLGYTYVFRSSRMEAKELMNYFRARNVEYAEPHFLYMTNEAAEPNDVLFPRYQWNLPAVKTIPGWDISKGSQDVVVAVVDTGADLTHPDLQGRLVPGFNVVSSGKPPQDDVGHGTHVAGIIAALVNNNTGVAGMSWYNKVMPVKVLDQTGAGNTYAVARGIIWAVDNGAKVINMSLGNYADAEFLHDAIRYAYDRDVVLIAASGNDNTEQPGYPAAYPEVFAVAATDSRQQKAPFSNFGDYIDAAAPGVNIASTYTNGQYAALSGTSMASPHVTALAALIRSVNPLLKNTEVYDIMRKSALDLGSKGPDKFFGHGQINVVRALQMATQNRDSVTFLPQWIDRQLDSIALKYKTS